MAKTDDAIIKDLRNWSDDKLYQWFRDSMTRYDVADIPTQDAACYAVVSLIGALGDIANELGIDAEMVGRDIATHIKRQQKTAVKS